MNKAEVVSYFNLTELEVKKIDLFINSIIAYNKHTNLIGKSTIKNIWDRHILDCLQITSHIKNKSCKILDLGTGAGLPGVLFSIVGYQNVLMVDSIKKKTDFINSVSKDLSLSAKTENKRIENLVTNKNEIIVSRALAPLKKLLSYSIRHSDNKTTLYFLKGKNVNFEINKAKDFFLFEYKKIKSISAGEGCILKIKNLIKKND